MTTGWYYAQNGVRNGPAAQAQLLSMIAAGTIRPSDQVWRDGMSGWLPIEQVPEFAASFPKAPPGLPSMPVIPATPSAPLKISMAPRVMMVVAGGLLLLSFFSPYFYCSVTPPAERQGVTLIAYITKPYSSLLWGWSFWWGILAMVFGTIGLTMAILSLALKRSPIMQAICKWVCLGVFGAAAILTILMTTLTIFGFGAGIYQPEVEQMGRMGGFQQQGVDLSGWVSFSDIRTGEANIRQELAKQRFNNQQAVGEASLLSIPITACLAVLAAVLGAVMSLLLVTNKKLTTG